MTLPQRRGFEKLRADDPEVALIVEDVARPIPVAAEQSF